jgi:L-amino acid N-acyltransferase YncA
MEFSIRMAREEDAESIVELLNPIIQAGTYTVMDEQLSVDDQINFMRGFPKRGVFNVAVCNDSQKVLGLQDVQPISTGSNAFRHVGEISTFVSLASRRNGIGSSLSHATFMGAREQGFLKLTAAIRADNPQAVLFYQSQGFEVIGTAKKHAFVRAKYIDEILMEKLIDHAPSSATAARLLRPVPSHPPAPAYPPARRAWRALAAALATSRCGGSHCGR